MRREGVWQLTFALLLCHNTLKGEKAGCERVGEVVELHRCGRVERLRPEEREGTSSRLLQVVVLPVAVNVALGVEVVRFH